MLVAAGVIAGPIIAENNPFSPLLGQQYEPQNQSTVVSYNPYETALSTVISSKPRDKIVDYSVVSGDTLASISKKFGISVDTVKWANNLKDDMIKPDQILKIAPVTGVVHKVVSGDTVYTIAKNIVPPLKASSISSLMSLRIKTPFGLQVGQIIYVPEGVIEEEKPKYFAPTYATSPGRCQRNLEFYLANKRNHYSISGLVPHGA